MATKISADAQTRVPWNKGKPLGFIPIHMEKNLKNIHYEHK